MKEKDLEKMMKEFNENMGKMIDEMGKREDFEKFKKEREGKSIEELLEELKESLTGLKSIKKPEFKIHIESDKEGEGRYLEIKGNRPSIMVALAEIARSLVLESNLTEDDIREAIETGIESTNEED